MKVICFDSPKLPVQGAKGYVSVQIDMGITTVWGFTECGVNIVYTFS